ncbi:P-loop containing nucleoside triphosphate hydrolase protein [Mycena polygramma]|nr:P-loop containing nucleoside triphosphate hydrolase protein [Mycena polygramma]
MNQDTKKTEETFRDPLSDPSIQVMQLGVWKVYMEAEATLLKRWQRYKSLYLTFKMLTIDFHSIAPILFPSIEVSLAHGQFDTVAITHATVARIAFVVLVAVVAHWNRKAACILQGRINLHVNGQEYITDNFDVRTVWYAYRDVLDAVCEGLSILSRLYYVATLFNSRKEAAIYFILSGVAPFARNLLESSLWEASWVTTSSEPSFNRLECLSSIVTKIEYKEEITVGNIIDYLTRQYRDAAHDHSMSDLSTSFPAEHASLYPSMFTLSNFATLAMTVDRIGSELECFINNCQTAGSGLTPVKQMYDRLNPRAQSTTAIGEVGCLFRLESQDYNDIEPGNTTDGWGANVDFGNVSFSYPCAKSDAKALHQVSFSIAPGQLVLIVGSNGSGKSTVLKLLSKLYGCASGTVAVDGEDIQKCDLARLRSATAVFTQGHHIYPLSLKENIALGSPEAVLNVGLQDPDLMKLVQESSRKGGAYEFIERLADKYDTVLEPTVPKWHWNCETTDESPLAKIHQAFEKKSDISGGQVQRVAASRTFMRLTSGNIKLVLADEPSSSLDPIGEQELFENIINERKGKTMIIVTHRFCHLVEHADLILCMKQGRLIEQGTHQELLALGKKGEYRQLYTAQTMDNESNEKETSRESERKSGSQTGLDGLRRRRVAAPELKTST